MSVAHGDDDLAVGLPGSDGGEAVGGSVKRQHGGDVDLEASGGGLLGERRESLPRRPSGGGLGGYGLGLDAKRLLLANERDD